MDKKTRFVAYMGFMFALTAVLSVIEGFFPKIPFLPPNFRLGLANIVIMYCVLSVGKTQSFILNILKSFFVFITRGAMAAALSFCGGMLSVVVIVLLVVIFKEKISYLGISVSGALAHNIGQFIALMFFFDTGAFVYYLPVMLITGIVTGALTGTLLRLVMPYIVKILMIPPH